MYLAELALPAQFSMPRIPPGLWKSGGENKKQL
jgi:hypothetical protein